MERRKCIICNKFFEKKANTSKKEWQNKYKCCSVNCANEYKRQNQVAWNRGLTKETDSRVLKNANSIKNGFKNGRKTWSKGIKGKDHPLYGKKLPKETRIKIGKAQTGKNHWNWQGGITDKVHSLRKKIKYQEWRIKVFEKDNYKCQHCGINKKLCAHHIKSFKKNPSLRYDILNGMTLCHSCHARLHSLRKRI